MWKTNSTMQSLTSAIYKIDIDIMKGSSFYKTLHYDYNPLFKFDNTELERCMEWVTDQCPSLKHRDNTTLFLKFPNGEEVKCMLYNKE